MRVAVIGSGGREHALVRALMQSPRVEHVLALPGNDGMAALGAECLGGDPLDLDDTARRLQARRVDLALVGPEAPLVAGLAGRLEAAGIAVFGPGREAARIEGSKAFAKAFMARHGIPTAPGWVFDDPAAAEDFLRRHPGPWVVKADGLAAGKGVLVCDDAAASLEAVRRLMRQGVLGAAGRRVVIEERLEGRELSVLAVTDGRRAHLLAPARDYKRLEDGDRGPNTGGMGAFSPVPGVSPALLDAIRRSIVEPAVAGLAAEGCPFRGVLYAGLMLTAQGPRVLEFNCRLGDPETQVLVPRLAGDLAELAWQAATGRLPAEPPAWRPEAAVCVVLATPGYPDEPARGLPITGLEQAAGLPGVFIDHAGTRREGGRWVAAGGRVVGVTALGSCLEEARRKAYAAVEQIRFPGLRFRRDIARFHHGEGTGNSLTDQEQDPANGRTRPFSVE
ncbi:phosphoribosylamine--glycine ligase [Thermaerobacter subterraneus]|uniref:Phosphoribosylamine--glycine ligase n=1 Tax=Thermaerobacter subterraneus DSM 13965 TaxID=867903 RepID=K6QFC4_9FIRM|nr:phosphoribosylamine--glycine ligase [Thermaerobacter subterraneus]EKP95691.1 phosphoribosylamine--glycine ligase [Thermaerobacter subterraneus DSM 13965]